MNPLSIKTGLVGVALRQAHQSQRRRAEVELFNGEYGEAVGYRLIWCVLGPYRVVLCLVVTLESGTRSWLYPVFLCRALQMWAPGQRRKVGIFWPSPSCLCPKTSPVTDDGEKDQIVD